MTPALAATLERNARQRAEEARTHLEAWVRAILHRAAWERLQAVIRPHG